MNTLTTMALVATAAAAVFYLWRLFRIVKTDGYIFRSSSGLPRDWSPSPDLPSLPYSVQPHR